MDIHMNSRQRVKAALSFKPVDKIPMEIEPDFLPEFDSDILMPSYNYGNGKTSGVQGIKGTRTDYWGSEWISGEDGVKGEVKNPIIKSRKDLDSLYIPYDVLEQADLSTVDEQCAASQKFTMKMWGIEPFQRMQYLRGSEELFIDIALEDTGLLRLMEMVHGFYKTEVELWATTAVDAIHLEDDWGAQNSMLISPKIWRELFKPLYKEYCDIAKANGKLVVMHSDGYIMDIIPDLIEIGVNAINPQLNIMPYDELSKLMRGKIALWGGIDRQWLLPFGSTRDAQLEVHKIAGYFCGAGNTGVVGQSFKDKDARPDNLRAIYNTWKALI